MSRKIGYCRVRLGAQPITSEDGNYTLAVNGEIYNHIQLRDEFPSYPYKSLSDCEPIIPLFEKYDVDAPKYLDGMFAWVLYDKKNDRIVASRDPIGITTLYMGKSSKNPKTRYFASELKCLTDECDEILRSHQVTSTILTPMKSPDTSILHGGKNRRFHLRESTSRKSEKLWN